MDQILQAHVAAQWARSEEISRLVSHQHSQRQGAEGIKDADINPVSDRKPHYIVNLRYSMLQLSLLLI